MTFEDLLEHQLSIRKLEDTSLLPWEDVLSTAPYFSRFVTAAKEYNKSDKSIDMKYARLGRDNLIAKKEAARDNGDIASEISDDLILISEAGLTIEQIEEKAREIALFQKNEIEDLVITPIDIKVIKKLYMDSNTRREKELSSGKSEEDKPGIPKEPYFTKGDVRAYIVLGITKKPESESQR